LTDADSSAQAFISALNQNPQQSYQQLLVTIRDELKGKYSQKPQLSASHPMDTQLLFIC
jgi:hypothetical protein